MRQSHLALLACPKCRESLSLAVDVGTTDSVEHGDLTCKSCEASYPILGSVPRFVKDVSYTDSFGFQWLKHPTTQHDAHTGSRISEARFFDTTGWPRRLTGQTILEVGCGSGRFSTIAASTGATVAAVDGSRAVEAAYAVVGREPNVLVVQADLHAMPFRTACFDRVCCLGVLQHTPDPTAAFLELTSMVADGGHLAVDVYSRRWWTHLLGTKYWIRPLVRGLDPTTLYRACSRYIDVVWPLARVIGRVPIGRYACRLALIPHYGGYNLDEPTLRKWAVLDLFDMLAPTFDRPQTISTVRRWFTGKDWEEVEVRYGWNGIAGRARKRARQFGASIGSQRAINQKGEA
jgi:SAM-dependent methyltransferase